ncbi:MAG: lecithin retinol acyltransferase family protein [Phycisphaerales bacterium]
MQNIPFRPGLHVRVWRGLYWHHAITICVDASGIAWLIEAGTPFGPGTIRWVTLAEFAGGATVCVVEHNWAFPPHVIVQQAMSRLDENRYNLMTNNCEHFATWCVTGVAESRQAQLLGLVSTIGLITLAARRAA